ncbi:ROK family protein [Microbacterium sp. LRZ72]|uniref:ROK family protein n=1 Tax=Microbacterium sp. LRZ72 TaxID=2942481 RepID=UPI0029B59F4E|nr:ROK family protein [Microbacterium sp. LRZ72]MDX2376087.1 ROK family protein [Microbacterium sp. LRZ72]
MTRPSATPAAPRRASLDAVLHYAWHAGVFTAGDAMPAVGLTRSTTIEALDGLVERGLLRELSNTRTVGDYSKGRPARRFELRADAAVVVGLDAGRAHATTTVADLRGQVLARQQVALDETHDSADERRAALAGAVDEALDAAGRGRDDVLALCAGVPAPVDAHGASPVHRDGFWRRMNPDLAELFGRWVPIVRIENDASLAALAEGSRGAAQGRRDYVTLLAGERLGAGVVVDGNLLRGAHGGVAEMVAFDHVAGVDGALGLGYRAAHWAREQIAAGALPAGHVLETVPPERVDGRRVFELAAAGDPFALGIVERVGEMLARIAALFGSLFDPRAIIVSGAVSGRAGAVLDAARERLPAMLHLPPPELVASDLGADVVSLGAVSAAVDAARAGVLDLTGRHAAAV